MMKIHTITDAKAHLSQLVKKALTGEEIIIGKAGHPSVKLVRYQEKTTTRKPGALIGKIKIASNFDDLPDDIAQALGLL